MTLPDERTRAVLQAQVFLRALLDPSKTPRVPLKIRQEAGRVLRHFPSYLDIDKAAKKAKDVFGKVNENTR